MATVGMEIGVTFCTIKRVNLKEIESEKQSYKISETFLINFNLNLNLCVSLIIDLYYLNAIISSIKFAQTTKTE